MAEPDQEQVQGVSTRSLSRDLVRERVTASCPRSTGGLRLRPEMIRRRRIASRRPSRMTRLLQPEVPRRVAIIGAGFAGLAAAAVFERSGIDYVVYEGANRVGGRVYSVPYGMLAMRPVIC
ncbi:unnamed protein product [Heligmosomoides polygyrus]|uniref:Amino_oxidase domain-containing protein n=1 Tax=Heligmosomoides polygyrus TaxID=6339 RepID=A0A183FVA8_HELPZ|nr:unnamed protein product [Heligmosomoides polygyrus]